MTFLIKLIYILSVLNNYGRSVYWGKKNVIDMRISCLSNKTRNLYLPMGQEDSVIVLVSFKPMLPQCTVNFYTFPDDNLRIVIVLKLLGKLDPVPCNDNIFIVQDNSTIDICDSVASNVYKKIFDSNRVSVIFRGKENFVEDVKMMVTSKILNTSCSNNEEMCILENNTVCINKKLLCDGDVDCENKNEENHELCSVLQEKIWWILLCTISMMFTVIFFCFRIIKKCVTLDNVDFFEIDSSITEGTTLTPQAETSKVKMPIKQSRDEPTTSVEKTSYKAVSETEYIFQSNTQATVSQLHTRPKQLQYDDFGESSTSKKSLQKVYQNSVNEEMILKSILYRRESGPPLKVTFYGSTTKL